MELIKGLNTGLDLVDISQDEHQFVNLTESFLNHSFACPPTLAPQAAEHLRKRWQQLQSGDGWRSLCMAAVPLAQSGPHTADLAKHMAQSKQIDHELLQAV